MKTYEEALQVVISAKKFGIVLGLERMEYMLRELGHPERQIPCIHLAGTNGKGSTLTYLKAILQEAGYTVGTYTSPFIKVINDKIEYKDMPISNNDFARIIEQIDPLILKLENETPFGPPTEFEIMTVMAFQYFATIAKPDIALIETGLGGRYDSTNVVRPLVSIITNIGHDHMDILGNTITEVAKEKAGIIKENTPVISGCEQREAIDVMKETAELKLAKLFQLNEAFFYEPSQKNRSFSFTATNGKLTHLKAGMLGVHQQQNAALAIMAIAQLNEKKTFQVTEEQIRRGLMKAKIANRIEIVQDEPTVIFDGGHNPEGTAALSKTLKETYPTKTILVLFCAMKDKDVTAMLKSLNEVATKIVVTSFENERVMSPKDVKKCVSTYNLEIEMNEDCVAAYNKLANRLNKNELLVVTGSQYFLTYLREIAAI